MPKIENTHINPHGFREYDARWLYPKDINGQGIKDVGRGLGSQIILKTKNYLFVDGRYTIQAQQQSGKKFKIIGAVVQLGLLGCNKNNWKEKEIRSDLEKSIKIFEKELGYSPELFSYPFGEYSSILRKIVADLNFEFAFGQHSGVIDSSKDFLELPRFPINEKYGELKRFKSIIQTLPFPYEKITPENRYIKENENPPKVKVKFFKDLIDVKNITCYSNEGNVWRKSDIVFIKENQLNIILKEKFKSERGRINCSLWAGKNKWRWLGIQYVIAEY